MDHELSISTKAAEKYLLGELPPTEREQFEQHYFECSECAADVHVGFEFAVNTRAVFRADAARAPRRLDRRAVAGLTGGLPGGLPRVLAGAMPLAASLILALFAGYQNAVVIPRLHSLAAESSVAQVLPSAVLVPASRGALPEISIPVGAGFFRLTLENDGAERFDRYQCDLRSGGKILFTVPLAAVDVEGVSLLIPARDLAAGTYEVALTGIAGQTSREIERYRFMLRR